MVPIGDAALARDALASQGTSIGISDARLAAEGIDLARRTADGRERHLHFLGAAMHRCRNRDAPVWRTYREWLANADAAAAAGTFGTGAFGTGA